MLTDAGHIIISTGDCACHTVHTTHARHHRFPEIRAEAGSPLEAAHHLEQILTRALDTALSHQRRSEMEQAIGDVQACIAALEGIDESSAGQP